MDASEFRLGNLVYDKYANIIKIKTIFPFNINVDFTDNEGLKTSDLKPIPINKEWLLNLSFSDGDFGITKSLKSDVWLEWDKNSIIITYFSTEIIIESIKYVHQLQNLYFSITGVGLTIK